MSIPPTTVLPQGVRRDDVDAPSGPLAALVADPRAGAPDAAAVLLVPGYTGSKEDFLPVLAPLAAAGHRAIAIDLRGQWESGGPEEASAYTIDALAKDVASVLPDDAHLVGHSFGGLVCRRAVLSGARPRSVTLIGSGPAAIGGTRRVLIELMRPILDEGGVAAIDAAATDLERDDPRVSGAPEDVRAFLRERRRASPAAALRTMGEELLHAPDEVDALRETGLPVLVLHGEGDDAWAPQEQRHMAERLGAGYVVVAEALHSPACEAPESTVEALLGFWRGLA